MAEKKYNPYDNMLSVLKQSAEHWVSVMKITQHFATRNVSLRFYPDPYG